MNRYSYTLAGAKSPRGKTSTAPTLIENANLETGRRQLEEHFGVLSTVELDLLRIAAAVFATDRASPRGERENLTRDLSLTVPVDNLEFFIPRTHDLQMLLRELSQDIWRIRFVARIEQANALADDELTLPTVIGKTLLFSGGLDSLAAAVEYSTKPDSLLLVSHKTRNTVTDRAQRNLVDRLVQAGRKVKHFQVFVSSRDSEKPSFHHDAEPSQRTRSFVFLTIGAVCARRMGHRELIYMAENGQLAIHLPLTSARISAFSTRTAHPKVLKMGEAFLSAALNFRLQIVNPYLYQTKAEVVARILKLVPAAIPASTSCWKNARVLSTGATHCGECVPCIMRRISIEKHVPDQTAYAHDVFSVTLSGLSEESDARRNLYDLAEFITQFRDQDNTSLAMEFPDLLSDALDTVAATEMYRRFAFEAFEVLSRYPALAPLLA